MSEEDLKTILTYLSGKIKARPYDPEVIGINYGIHFTGGEPFLNYNLLIRAVQMAQELRIPSLFVETNCFWCLDDETTRDKITSLKDAGLKGLLVSVNPFITEEVPFERTERAIRIGREIFRGNVIVYQQFFYNQFKRSGIKGVLSFEEYLQVGKQNLHYIELIPMGRAVYKLGYLFRKYQAKKFFGESCARELTRPWHVHIDNYCNYMTGFCGGISLGDARNLDVLCQGIDLDEYLILGALVRDIKRLYELGTQEFDYPEQREGYVSKCHLCVDIRRHIAQQADRFKELRPREFYLHLE